MSTFEQRQNRDATLKEMGLTQLNQSPQLRLRPEEYRGWGVALNRVLKMKDPERFYEPGCNFLEEHWPLEETIYSAQINVDDDGRLIEPDLTPWYGDHRLLRPYKDYPDFGLRRVESDGWRRALDRLIHLAHPDDYYVGVDPAEHWRAEMQIALAQAKYEEIRQDMRENRGRIGAGALVLATIALGGGFVYQENWSPDAERKRKEAYQREHELVDRSPLDEIQGWIEPTFRREDLQPVPGERNSFIVENGRYLELPGGVFDSVRATAIQITGYRDSKGFIRPKFVIVQKRERPSNKITEFKERVPVGQDHPEINGNVLRFRRGQDNQAWQIAATDQHAAEDKVKFEFVKVARGGDI